MLASPDHDPNPDLSPTQRREAARRRQRNRQREDLIAAARVLIPEHGLGLPLGRIAVHAGLSRHAAAALFNATTDLAVELVRRAWLLLIETLVPEPDARPAEKILARLIDAIRADAPAHRIHAALCFGLAAWQRETLAHIDALLALVVGEALGPALPPDAAAGLGRRVLALARAAALDPGAGDAPAEAARLATMLAPLLVAPPLVGPPLVGPPLVGPLLPEAPAPDTLTSARSAPRLPCNANRRQEEPIHFVELVGWLVERLLDPVHAAQFLPGVIAMGSSTEADIHERLDGVTAFASIEETIANFDTPRGKLHQTADLRDFSGLECPHDMTESQSPTRRAEVPTLARAAPFPPASPRVRGPPEPASAVSLGK